MDPALHPRTGAPPNPGWFAPTGGASHDAPTVRLAENNDPTRRSDASREAVDNWVHLPPAKRIDELGDFLEWLANAKPEDEQTIRAEINRYWGSVGDIQAVSTLNYMLSQVLKPGTTRRERQQILELIDKYSRYDPAEVAQFYDQLFDSILLLFPGMPRRAGGPKQKPTVLNPGAATSAAEQAAADKAAWDNMNWDERGRYFEDRAGRTLHRNFPVIDKIPDGLAASIKSMDFRAATYQKATPFAYRLKIYVGEVSEFVGGQLGKDVVKPSDVKGRVLEVVIPTGTMTPKQREIVEAVRVWAKTLRNPVEIIINEK